MLGSVEALRRAMSFNPEKNMSCVHPSEIIRVTTCKMELSGEAERLGRSKLIS